MARPTTTMNGWSLLDVPRETIRAGGLSTTCRSGDVAVVLQHVAKRFHDEVEVLETFHGWRSVETNEAVGGHQRSNHPSGTALDLNGFKHPYKKPHGFTDPQVVVIRRILAEVAPVVRWGGDFGEAFRDGMHFEIVKPPADVADVVRRLRLSPSSTASTSSQEDDMPTADEVATAVVDTLMARFILAGNAGLPVEAPFGALIGDIAVHARRAAFLSADMAQLKNAIDATFLQASAANENAAETRRLQAIVANLAAAETDTEQLVTDLLEVLGPALSIAVVDGLSARVAPHR